MAHFEDTTAALVLNQVDNPGGSLFHVYKLLSCLTDRPLPVPKHQITISEDHKARAARIVALAEAGEAVAPERRPSPELVEYSRFVLSEDEAGRGTGLNVTNPVHLDGVAEILPADHPYTKGIVVLINELTFSAAEFLAAILQDARRATLFGVRTAGAGGCATHKRMQGIEGFMAPHLLYYTWTVAWRTNGQPIENVGVHPDIEYGETVEDLTTGHRPYRQALLDAIAGTL